MAQLTDEYMDDKLPPEFDTEFPNAPKNWTRDEALQLAKAENIQMGDLHWRVIRVLQDYFREHPAEHIDLHQLHEVLEQNFASEGGMKYLHKQFPDGPINQGCRLAGLKPPPGSYDAGFGSGA